MEARRHEFVDSRLRRYPPDREDAVPCGQAWENEACFPRLAHRSAAAHKLHSATATEGLILNLFPGIMMTTNRVPALAYSPPEPVQPTGTTAENAQSVRVASGRLLQLRYRLRAEVQP